MDIKNLFYLLVLFTFAVLTWPVLTRGGAAISAGADKMAAAWDYMDQQEATGGGYSVSQIDGDDCFVEAGMRYCRSD